MKSRNCYAIHKYEVLEYDPLLHNNKKNACYVHFTKRKRNASKLEDLKVAFFRTFRKGLSLKP